jgi:hypothetical protein
VPDGTSTELLYLRNLAGTEIKYYGVDILPTSGGMGATAVTVYGNRPCTGGAPTVQRCFEISPTMPQTADITFYYRDDEENGQDTARAWHWVDSGWELQGFGGRDRSGVENNWVRATDVVSYSPFALSNEAPTAVRLAHFGAEPRGNGVLVTWQTASELDNVGFNLYRSQMEESGYVRVNESLIPSRFPGMAVGAVYTWLDSHTEPGVRYYYRLEDLDAHGIRTVHGPVWAELGSPGYSIFLPVVNKRY